MVTTTIERPPATCRHDDAAVRFVRLWLWVVAFLVFVMIVVDGVARLWVVNLSATRVDLGIALVPPLDDAAWGDAFARWLARLGPGDPAPAFDSFRAAYAWGWSRRLVGWLTGLALAGPLLLFWVTDLVGRSCLPRWLLVSALGWWVAASFLGHGADVDPLRAAFDLTLASLFFSTVLWVVLTLSPGGRTARPTPVRRIGAAVILIWILGELFLGALVTGHPVDPHYHTWPLLDGRLVPDEVFAGPSIWGDMIGNPVTALFLHRMAAYLLFAMVLAQFVTIVVTARTTTAHVSAYALGFMVMFQIMVGIATLLMHTPFALALIHHTTAVVVLACAVIHAVSVFAPGRMETSLVVHEPG